MKKIILNLLFFICIFSLISNISYAKSTNSTIDKIEVLNKLKDFENRILDIDKDYQMLKNNYGNLEKKYIYLQNSHSSLKIDFEKVRYEWLLEKHEKKNPVKTKVKKIGKRVKKFIKKI